MHIDIDTDFDRNLSLAHPSDFKGSARARVRPICRPAREGESN